MGVLRWYNGTRLKRAGSEHSATAILTHVGRRSGRAYETPLGAAGYGDGFVLSLAYGPGTDWCRNVMAAGRGTLAWKGQTYELERPEIISGPQVLRAWPDGSGSRCVQRASRSSYGCTDTRNKPEGPIRLKCETVHHELVTSPRTAHIPAS